MAEVARILVVDDDDDARDIVVATLEDGDFDRITAAASAGEGYALLDVDNDDESEPPAFDVVLLDIVMPEIDGIEACARIRATRRYRDVPILMVSSQRDSQSLTQAFVAGANDYVTKPVERIELLARVRSALRLKRELDRRRLREEALRARAMALQAPNGGDADPERSVIEQRIDQFAAADKAAGLLALAIREFDAYAAAHGRAAADAVETQVGAALRDLPAPLGFTLARYAPGLFLVLAPDAADDRLVRLARDALTRLAEMRLVHGNSAQGEHVTLDWAVVPASGAELLTAPARAIEQVRRPQFAQGETA